MTELTDYLRLLWARASTIVCEGCSREVHRGTVAGATDAVLASDGERAVVTWRVPVDDAERYLGVRERLLEEGYRRALILGEARDLDEVAPSEVIVHGGIDVIADRLKVSASERSRVAEALSTSMAKGGRAEVHWVDRAQVDKRVDRYSRGLDCAHCGRTYPEPTPALFSFQSPLGACENCRGFGRIIDIDWEKVVPDASLSIDKGAIKPWTGKTTAFERKALATLCKAQKIPTDKAWRELPEKQRDMILEGTKGFTGVRAWFSWLEGKAYQMHVRVFLSRFRRYTTCPSCNGSRVRSEVSRYRVSGLSIGDAGALPVTELPRPAGVGALGRRGDRPGAEGDPGEARLPRRRGRRVPLPGAGVSHALRRRGAARGAHRRAWHLAHRDADGARRAHRGAPSPGRRAAHRGGAGHRAARQRGADHRARPRRDRRERPGDRARSRGGRGGRTDHLRRRPGLAHPRRNAHRRGPPLRRAGASEAPQGPWVSLPPRGARAQPQGGRPGHPHRGAHGHHGGLGVGQELAGGRDALPRGHPCARGARARGARGGVALLRLARRRRRHHRRGARRPGSAGPHHPRKPRDLSAHLRPHPGALRLGAGVQGARILLSHLLVQRRGRALPHLRGGGATRPWRCSSSRT